MTGTPPHPLPVRLSTTAGLLGGMAWFAFAVDGRITDPHAVVLALCVVAANLLAVHYSGQLWMSASFTFSMLAVVELGPAAAFAIVAAGELASWLVERYRPRAALVNLVGAGLPNLVVGTLYEAIAPADLWAPAGVLATSLLVALALGLNYLIVRTLTFTQEDGPFVRALVPPRRLFGPLAVSLGLTATFATLAQHGATAVVSAGVVLAAIALRQLLSLTEASRHERAALSRGLVVGLVQSLAERDPGAARHAAAVAVYSREIALAAGHGPHVGAAAHTAGLVHDIGLIALSDHAVEGGNLDYEGWALIRRHPDLGATMIRGLGNVADAVRCHHERLDGHGYPRGLAADEIPLLARIVAVAEVYDTLTHGEGRPRSSFGALQELRRVAGTQLDPDYVEALASTLAGLTADDRQGVRVTVDGELAAHERAAAAMF